MSGASASSRGGPAPLDSGLRQFLAVTEPVVALTHVRVVDGTGAPPAEDQVVVVANEKIQAVGRMGTVAVPSGARTMDLTGHTVIPGMVGLHDHSFYGGGGGAGRLLSGGGAPPLAPSHPSP